jgi:hypothetical protein
VPRPMSLAAFMSANLSKDGNGFVETARRIAGEIPPPWLAKHFQRWSSSVMLDGQVHAKQLGKAEARARLTALSEATALVARELHDSVVAALLLADEFGPMPNLAGIDAVLVEIRRRADIASSRLNLLGTGLDEKLERLSDGAKLVAREIRDSALSEILEAEQIIGPPAPTIELSALLKKIGRQADAALLAPYLATETGKTKAGRGRALPPHASSPRAFCAAIILEAWAHFHDGEYPSGSNHRPLAKAAVEYWRACGGTAEGGWGNDKLLAWRPYFQEASEPPLDGIRTELRRHMKLSAEFND